MAAARREASSSKKRSTARRSSRISAPRARAPACSKVRTAHCPCQCRDLWKDLSETARLAMAPLVEPADGAGQPFDAGTDRSEEHTSELQSRPHLVCRLLLDKKNT